MSWDKRFEIRMFWVHSDSIELKVLHVLCRCYAAINFFIKIFNVLTIFFPYIILPPNSSCPPSNQSGGPPPLLLWAIHPSGLGVHGGDEKPCVPVKGFARLDIQARGMQSSFFIVRDHAAWEN